MFSITCDSCAAKLKVRAVAAIGQVLACPRCGEMVRVAAPEGFVPPVSGSGEQSSLDNVSDPSVAGFSDFDDIPDALLDRASKANGPSLKPAAPPGDPFLAGPPSTELPPQPVSPNRPAAIADPIGRAAANAAFLAAESDRRRREVAATTAGVLAPLEARADLQSAGAARHRKVLIAGIVAAASVAAIVGLVLMLRTPKNPAASRTPATANRPAADKSPGEGVEPSAEEGGRQPPSGEPATQSPATASDATGNSRSGNPSLPADPPGVGAEGSVDQPAKPSTQEPEGPPPIDGLDPPVSEAVAPALEPPTSGNLQEPVRESPLGTLPQGPGNDRLPGRIPASGANDSIPDALGELTSILDQQGRTLTAIEGAAAATRPARRPGIPRLNLRKPEPVEPVDLAAVLQLPVGRVTYDGVPQIVVLRELAQLAGVPVVWDFGDLEAAGIDLNQAISFDVRNGKLDDAFAKAAGATGLACSVQPWGLAVGLPDNGEIASETFPAEGTRLGQGQLELVATALPSLIDPASWAQPEPVRSAVVNGNQLVVQQSRRNLRRISALVKRLGAVATEEGTGLDNRTTLAQPALDQPLQLAPGFGAPLDEFLSSAGGKVGVTILVDWSVVGVTGWTPVSRVPSRVDADTVRDLLEQLCQAMDLEWLAVGPRSFLLTTPAAARQVLDVEVYGIGQLLDEQLTSERIQEILFRAVAAGNPADTYTWTVFDPVSKSLIIAAPQQVQRQVHAVLQALVPPAAPATPEPERPVQQVPGDG